MHESSKLVPSWRSGAYFNPAEDVQPLRKVEPLPIELHARPTCEKTANRAAMEKADGGRLAGSSDSVTENLREAVRETLGLCAAQGWLKTTVPLSTERQQFAFAKIGAVPTHCDAGKVLVIVPQFDEFSGANRIASAFSLNWAGERIIARILQGQCPRHIGADLRLTEATVRAYTKRIMLKLGINRQSEFFLLYHLTQSPFGAGRREKAVGRLASDARLNGESAMGLWTPDKRTRD